MSLQTTRSRSPITFWTSSIPHSAADYQVLPDRILLYDGQRQLIFEHRLLHPAAQRWLWTSVVHIQESGPFTVAWTSDDEVSWHGRVYKDRPTYSFRDEDVYRDFQSQVRQVDFIKQFETKSIEMSRKGSTPLADSFGHNIKIWQSTGITTTRSLTVPLRLGEEIDHRELLCTWLKCKRKDSKDPKKPSNQVHLSFKATKQKRNSSASKVSRSPSFGLVPNPSAHPKVSRFVSTHLHLHKSPTWGSASRRDSSMEGTSAEAQTHELLPEEIASDPLLHEFSELTVTFKIPEDCTTFIQEVEPYLRPRSSSTSSARAGASQSPQSPKSNMKPSPSVASKGAYSTERGSISSTSPPSTIPSGVVTASDVHKDSLPRLKLASPKIPSEGGTAPEHPYRSLNPFQAQTIAERPKTMAEHQPTPATPWQLLHPPPRSPSRSPRDTSTFGGHSGDGAISPRAVPSDIINKQRERYWSRQTETAPIANTARVRAERNKRFYETHLKAKEELRILRILPGRDKRDERLELEFEKISLHDATDKYEALSYCWGPGDEMREIVVNKKPGFQVSLHLEQALRRLRLPDKARPVWIDAICINQADLLEMNHQVNLMGRIYRLARRTIIWISEFTDTLTQPTCTKRYVAEQDDTKNFTLCALPGGAANEHNDVDSKLYGMLPPFHQELEFSKSGNAWYLRLWCVQEFHFSQKLPSIYLGQHAIGWAHFASIFKQIVGENGPLALFEKLRNTEKRTTHGLLTTTGSFRCSDPRDRIYALLNMTEDHESKVSPDYAKSILEVLEEVTRYLILESNTVDVLLDQRVDRTCGAGYGETVVPTFIPDFTCLQALEMTSGKDEYLTGGERSPDVYLGEDDQSPGGIELASNTRLPRVLEMKCVRFDRITYHTTLEDIPRHETSPSGCLIYNNLQKPGDLVKSVLKALHYEFTSDMTKWDLDRSPRIGRLILEYIYEEERNHLEELARCTSSAGTNLKALYRDQQKQDVKYVDDERQAQEDGMSIDGHWQQRAGHISEQLAAEDKAFIDEHWKRRIGYISEEKASLIDIKKMLDETQAPWNEGLRSDQTVRKDFQAAIEFENLYCYARRTRARYYLSGQDRHRPMRRNVLMCKDMDEINELETQFEHRNEPIELHEYSQKGRQRDFFRTDAGFVGLGPSVMKDGDIIVVPFGASRPFILRQSIDTPGEAYTLIGEAVLPGIMHAQWLTENRERQARYYRLR